MHSVFGLLWNRVHNSWCDTWFARLCKYLNDPLKYLFLSWALATAAIFCIETLILVLQRCLQCTDTLQNFILWSAYNASASSCIGSKQQTVTSWICGTCACVLGYVGHSDQLLSLLTSVVSAVKYSWQQFNSCHFTQAISGVDLPQIPKRRQSWQFTITLVLLECRYLLMSQN